MDGLGVLAVEVDRDAFGVGGSATAKIDRAATSVVLMEVIIFRSSQDLRKAPP